MATASAPRVGPDEDDDYKATMTKYRAVAVECTNLPLWHTTMLISNASKQPMSRFLNWAQKQVREHNEMRAAAARLHMAFMGPTPLSTLVRDEAGNIYNEMCSLLTAAASDDPLRWGPLWDMVPDAPTRASAAAVAVQLALNQAASWK
eukprot:1781154-Pyramimonas_sp.AAC.1